MKSLFRHKILATIAAIIYMILPTIFNVWYLNRIKTSIDNEIKDNKELTLEEAELRCQADNVESNGKFYLLIDDIRSNIIELQYQDKTLEEETTYLSNQNKELFSLISKRKKK